jgi:hypothetical protein
VDISADAGFLWDKATMLRDEIKGTHLYPQEFSPDFQFVLNIIVHYFEKQDKRYS